MVCGSCQQVFLITASVEIEMFIALSFMAVTPQRLQMVGLYVSLFTIYMMLVVVFCFVSNFCVSVLSITFQCHAMVVSKIIISFINQQPYSQHYHSAFRSVFLSNDA